MLKNLTIATLAVTFAGTAMAQDPQNAAFLSYSPDAQKGYVGTSLLMAQALLSKSQGECISKWTAANKPSGYQLIIDVIKKYPDAHPSAVVAAVIEKECGKLELAQR